MRKIATLRSGLMLAAPLAVLGWVQPASAAGLFDFLFGGYAEPRPTYQYAQPPLGVQVNPRRKPRVVREGSESRAERRGTRQASIDPVTHPDWYLTDTTLRRGDIVVTKAGVLVYDGGQRGANTPEDFTALSRSPLVSKADRARIAKMARRDPSDSSPVVRAPSPSATLEPGASSVSTGPKEAALQSAKQ